MITWYKERFKPMLIRSSEKTAVLRAITTVVTKHTHHNATRHPHVSQFEKKIANILGKPMLGVESGTAALELSLRALGITEGDEVIVPAFCFISTASVVKWIGATPVFVDISEEDFAIDVKDLKRRITHKTKAVIVAHLFGQPATHTNEILRIAKEYNVTVIEDVAQSFGSQIEIDGKWRYCGSIADVGCFSFSSTKPFSAAGNAGAIATNDNTALESLKTLRYYGFNNATQTFESLGTCAKLHDIHAATLLQKLNYFNYWSNYRARLAETYHISLERNPTLILPTIHKHTMRTWNYYPIRIKNRDGLYQKLCVLSKKNSWLHPTINYDTPLPALPMFQEYNREDYPTSTAIAGSIISLPLNNYVHANEINEVIAIVNEHVRTT